MALIDDFKAKFPFFDEDTVDGFWSLITELQECLYGPNYGDADCSDQAILFLLAHLFSGFTDPQYSGGGAFRQLASASVGNVSATYGTSTATPSTIQEFYGSTPYGTTFLMLIRTRMAVFPG